MSSSIIIAGWVDFSAKDREAVLSAFAPLVKATLAEDGCIDYAITPDPSSGARIRIFEHWTSDEALADHHKTEPVRAWYESVAGFPRSGKSISRHVVTLTEAY
jgi:quinol monooxygenase YgiN